jgi:hypothetical protein
MSLGDMINQTPFFPVTQSAILTLAWPFISMKLTMLQATLFLSGFVTAGWAEV